MDRGAVPLVFGDLTEYLRQPIEEIAREYWAYREGADRSAQERVANATNPADVLAYYAATPHYLYELSYWEASLDKQAWLRVAALACRRFKCGRVLDFGGGVGGTALTLNRCGIPCAYLDVAGKTFEYASWRFARHGVAVRMVDAAGSGQRRDGSYDAIFAWDVLEHLFDLEEALGTIHGMLRSDGLCISKSTFATSGSPHEAIHLAQHACYDDVNTFNGLMARCGFRFAGQLKPNRLSRLLRACGWRYAVAGIRIAPRLKHGGNFLLHVKASLPAADGAREVPEESANGVGDAARR
ncbi:MAG TPA: class I SAM-dependent methyltransferase [bacterium]